MSTKPRSLRAQNSKSGRANKRQLAKSSRTQITGEVRIIGGQFKRQFVPFIDADGLRPSPDRLRETLFNWLQFELHDANVLDLCAGSGVLGFEALSRGAGAVTFIELNTKQAKLIEQTCEKLKLSAEHVTLYVGDALDIIPTLPSATEQGFIEDADLSQPPSDLSPYHFVFVDPPYDLDLWVPLLNRLIENNKVSAETLFYIEDRRPLAETLSELTQDYQVLKSTKIGQVYANLIQLNL